MDTHDNLHRRPRPATPEDLLAHAGWVRALSRVLVSDPHTAEDVEQDAWVAALKRPPSQGDGLRAWWARVVRNEASDARRSRSRRSERELAAPVREDVETPLEANSALEAQRKLVAAIDTLEEPLRATVIRRYVQGMTSPEIAKLDGVSESTVRTRLQRALEALRRELDERTPGGRAAWSALLAPLALPDRAVAAAGAVAAATATKSAPWISIGVAAAVVAAVVIGVVVPERSVARADSETALVEPARASEIPTEGVVGSPAADGSRTPAASAAGTAEAPAERRAVASRESPVPRAIQNTSTEPARISVRFVDSSGNALPGVDLVCTARTRTEEIPADDAPRATSGSDGRAVLELLRDDVSRRRGRSADAPANEWAVSLESSGAGWRKRELDPTVTFGAALDLGAVVLEPGADVRVRLVDVRGGPIVDGRGKPLLADVTLIAPDLSPAERESAVLGHFAREQRFARSRSDRDGVADLRGAPVGTYRIWAKVPWHSDAISEPFTLRAGDSLALPDLVCTENAASIRGRVLLADGSPAIRADVTYRLALGTEVIWTGTQADADGRFSLEPRTTAPLTISAVSGRPKSGERVIEGVLPGTRGLEIRLPEPRSIAVRVVDEANVPVEAYMLGVFLVEDGSGDYERRPRPDGLGSVRARALPFKISIASDGFESQSIGPFEQDTAPARVDVVLRRIATVRGRVVDAGAPLRGVTVHLSRVLAAPGTNASWFPQRVSPSIAESDSAPDGTFTLSVDQQGEFVVWAQSDLGVVESAPIRVGSTGVDEVVLDFAATGRIEGRVVSASDRAGEDMFVVLSSGLPSPRAVALRVDGTFVVEGVAPGRWLAVVDVGRGLAAPVPDGASYQDHPTLQRLDVSAGSTTTCTFDLTAIEPREVDGRIALEGCPPVAWVAGLQRKGAPESARRSQNVDGSGRFRVAALAPGEHALVLRAVGGPEREDRVELDVVLRHGRIAWELERRCGTLAVEGPALAERVLTADLGASGTWTTRFRLDASGRALLDGLPAGRVRILGADANAAAIELDVESGRTVTIHVP